MQTLGLVPILLLQPLLVAAQAGAWAIPFGVCFHWGVLENDHCDAPLGFGWGTCESGYQATWLGVCEKEHDDEHDHLSIDADSLDHTHFSDFSHDYPPSPSPPPSTPPSTPAPTA